MLIEFPDINAILMSVGQCVHDVSLSRGLYISLFLAGLFGGLTHCSVMCGPFVMSQVGEVQKMRQALLLPYHFGRMTTYVVLAMLVQSIVGIAFLFLPVRAYIVAPLLMFAGLVFLVTAFPSLARIFPWVARLQIGVPFRFISSLLARLGTGRSVTGRYFMGVLLGFMPCGLIVSALMAAATAPSAIEAGVAMAAFAAGTMPALIAVAFGGRALRTRFPRAMHHVTRGFMAVSALWLFLIAGLFLF